MARYIGPKFTVMWFNELFLSPGKHFKCIYAFMSCQLQGLYLSYHIKQDFSLGNGVLRRNFDRSPPIWHSYLVWTGVSPLHPPPPPIWDWKVYPKLWGKKFYSNFDNTGAWKLSESFIYSITHRKLINFCLGQFWLLWIFFQAPLPSGIWTF